jgi:hypothetical protein
MFCLFYKSLLSRETFFRFNRIVVLSGLAICIFLPFISIPAKEISVFQKPFVELEKRIEIIHIQQETIVNDRPEPIISSQPAPVGFLPIISFIYITGICINFILIVLSNYKMFRLLHKGEKIRHEKYTIILVRENIVPFSFGKLIALSPNDYRQNFREIICHESIHIQQRHTSVTFGCL